MEAWRVVSACYLTHLVRGTEASTLSPERGLYCAPRWLNPRALVPLPEGVRRALDALRPLEE